MPALTPDPAACSRRELPEAEMLMRSAQAAETSAELAPANEAAENTSPEQEAIDHVARQAHLDQPLVEPGTVVVISSMVDE